MNTRWRWCDRLRADDSSFVRWFCRMFQNRCTFPFECDQNFKNQMNLLAPKLAMITLNQQRYSSLVVASFFLCFAQLVLFLSSSSLPRSLSIQKKTLISCCFHSSREYSISCFLFSSTLWIFYVQRKNWKNMPWKRRRRRRMISNRTKKHKSGTLASQRKSPFKHMIAQSRFVGCCFAFVKFLFCIFISFQFKPKQTSETATWRENETGTKRHRSCSGLGYEKLWIKEEARRCSCLRDCELRNKRNETTLDANDATMGTHIRERKRNINLHRWETLLFRSFDYATDMKNHFRNN